MVEDKARPPPRRRRVSVSAEADTGGDAADAFTPTLIPKSPEERARIEKAVAKNFLFSSLNEEQRSNVFGAMKEMKVDKDVCIITQGDTGDFFYVLDEGSAEVLVSGNKVHQYSGGSAFGELALMYNCPRAATVRATEASVLWALDRMTFRHILYANQSKKKDQYEEFLKTMPLLQEFSAAEITRIADVLEERTFQEGETIIKQGDDDIANMRFYIVIKGRCLATKVLENPEGEQAAEPITVGCIEAGGFFGEKALIEKAPRAASVCVAAGSGPAVCASLDIAAFERLLGPCKGKLQVSIDTYTNEPVTVEAPVGSGFAAVRALTPSAKTRPHTTEQADGNTISSSDDEGDEEAELN